MPIPIPPLPPELLAAGLLALLLLNLLILLTLLLRRDPAVPMALALRQETEALRLSLAGVQRSLEMSQRTEAETLRTALVSAERALSGRAEVARMEAQTMLADLTGRLLREQADQRLLLEGKLREMSDQAELRLQELRRSVTENLATAVETQMQGSFQRVVDQFTQLQRAMAEVRAVSAQVGDLRRVFSNVKSRGAWGEAQLRAILEDVLPAESWAANRKLRDDTDEVVEFVLILPSRSTPRPLLALDSKFPLEDWERLLAAHEAGDAEGERTARRGLEARLRAEAKSIGRKYVVPPVTVDFAVLYLPTDGLYAEAARIPGLIEAVAREHRVIVMGPALLPALLRTIQLGAVTLSIEERAEEIRRLLGAVRTEFMRMDDVLGRLEKQAGAVGASIGDARRRTRAMERRLRGVTALAAGESAAVLALDEDEVPS